MSTLIAPRMLAGALAMALAPALAAQTMDQAPQPMPIPEAAPATPAPAQPHAEKPAEKQASASPGDPHAGHAMPMTPSAQPAAAQGKHEAASRMDHVGMAHGTPLPKMGDSAMDRARMQHGAMPSALPRTPIPPISNTDRAAALRPETGHLVEDNAIHSYTLLNRLEAWDAAPGTGLAWEGQSWIGTDRNRLWLRSEGERVAGRTEAADVEVLYGRSLTTWWDLVIGLRNDFAPGNDQRFAAIGVQGLAPMKFEIEATAYVGENGQTAARFEGEYELLLSNRLIVQPLLEANLYGRDDRRRGIGAGLSTVEAGLRLRYEFTRRFAPYIGVVYERAFGHTADRRRDEFEPIDDTRIVAGFRIWF